MRKPFKDAGDADDVRAYDEIKRRLETGEEELMPAEFVDRLLDGESPIRVWREYRGLSIAELAAQVGLRMEELDEIERGTRAASNVARLAEALDLDIDDLATSNWQHR